uniref:Oberon coiled-coil region domain-containing protein n=1 Tax=Brassica oleracea var. oleracea TaxID=109376 RepID=A0A0D3A411_BRAOL
MSLKLSIVDRELEAKAKEVAKLQAERQKKKLQRDELERIVRLKQAEADMLQLKVSEKKWRPRVREVAKDGENGQL